MGHRNNAGWVPRLVLPVLTALLLGPSVLAQPKPPPAGRDPFAPLVTKPKPESPEVKEALAVTKLKLVGIIWDRERRRAMVETPEGLGYVLKESDEVFGAKVVAIQRDRVRFLVRDVEAGTATATTRTIEFRLYPVE